ncbi:MYG1 family protein [Ruminococcaceae bacterium OttesenSCG-928-D13]|nr:MYG1 family protein [Ruminococcaceae bacterium OttesenSCG-928-D13]
MDFSNNPAGIPQLGFTHGGKFHADDVLSAALLTILRPDIRIYRGYQVPKNFSGIVFDIGDGPFDHHQKGSPRRENGAAYAAFGLLWREYGHFFLSEKEAKRFDTQFIQPLDIDDNKGTGNVLAGLIGAFNPTWDSDADPDKAFYEAVEVATKLLSHKLESLAAVERGKKLVEEALKGIDGGIVELDRYIPWKPVLVESPAEFVIFPSPRGGYSLQCVPKDYNGKTGNKVPLPVSWHARPAAELQEITGVPEISFCHASGFMCSVSSVAGARKLARLAQAEYAKRQAEKAAQKAELAQNAQAGTPGAGAGEASGSPTGGMAAQGVTATP